MGHGGVVRYGAAVGITIGVVGVCLLCREAVAPTPSDLLLAAVAVSAWLGGLGPAILAAVLSVCALDYFFLDPLYAINPLDPRDAISLFAFLIVALLVSALSANLRRARDRAEAAHFELEANERVRDQFIAMIVHDLTNPLTAIRGYAQIIQDTNTRHSRAVNIILRQTERLERLLEDLRAASGRNLDSFPLRRGCTDLLDILREGIAEAYHLSEQHDMALVADVDRVDGYWDRDRIAQVVGNLLGNAVKYSPDGGRIEVRVEVLDDAVEVSIRDEGLGIHRDVLGRLFEQFYRVKDTASRASGQGLGLYISRMIVEAHGGALWAESAGWRRGSTFTFVLPVGEIPEDELVPARSDADASPPLSTPLRIAGPGRFLDRTANGTS